MYVLQVGLLNVDGYYNSLLSFIDKAVEEGFISPNAREIIVSAPTAKELVKKLEVISYACRYTNYLKKMTCYVSLSFINSQETLISSG